jgi:endonuclease-3 related protein
MQNGQVLQSAYDLLLAHFGPQHWWPGETPFEVIVGAVLTQNTSWKNVHRAIENLREAGLLDFEGLRRLNVDELAELIRPAGYFRLKARRLKNLLDLIHEQYEGSLEAFFATNLDTLREQLLSVNGVGPETADSILLYAADKPTFVIDAYTHRVAKRHGWVEPEMGYHDLKEHFESALPPDVPLYNEYHALLVRVGHEFCKPRPCCEACPLRELLPEGGPIEPES